jgi:tRNA nucleotidyltransferase (CCA-adding enzyme)
MEPFGGGGHPQASSALVKGRSGGEVFREFLQHINSNLNPAVTAGDVMSEDVKVLDPDMTLRDASIFLENINHTGAPVVDKAGGLIGILTLRNIMKARRASQMNAPVRAFMTRKVITGTKDMTMRAVESIFYKHNIGHLPILDGGRLVGLVTRTDYLEVIGNVENHRPAAAPSDDAASASDGEIKY